MFLPNADSKGKLVLEINQPDKKNVFWTAKNIEDFAKTPGKWCEIKLEFSFTNKDIMVPLNGIKIYPWNLSKSEIYIDDFRVEFVS